MDEEPSKEWKEGCEAYHLGWDWIHNPYCDDKEQYIQYRDWLEGWEYADKNNQVDEY